jgi:Raf kinase inhibitor-like YbhB/YbcL family protein
MKLNTFLAVIGFTAATMASPHAQAPQRGAAAPAAPGLTLTTTAFADGAEIPAKYTQSVAAPVAPALAWDHVPAGTVAFALIVNDPDVARMRRTEDMLHWLAFNIPGTARALPEGVPATAELPDGTIQGKNGGGTVGFRGPGASAAGPHHHYTWQLFALDTKLTLGPDATRDDVLKAMDGHILGKGVMVGRFHR